MNTERVSSELISLVQENVDQYKEKFPKFCEASIAVKSLNTTISGITKKMRGLQEEYMKLRASLKIHETARDIAIKQQVQAYMEEINISKAL